MDTATIAARFVKHGWYAVPGAGLARVVSAPDRETLVRDRVEESRRIDVARGIDTGRTVKHNGRTVKHYTPARDCECERCTARRDSRARTIVAESAPSRTLTMDTRTLPASTRNRRAKRAGRVTMAHALECARYGASQALKSRDDWNLDDIAHCTADILNDAFTAALESGRIVADCFTDPAMVTVGAFYGRASNWRRSEESRRVRDSEHTGTLAGRAHTELEDELDALDDGSWQAAARTASAMLDALGLPAEGVHWTLAYSAARAHSAPDMDAPAIADELGLTVATVRQHIARAIKRTPSVQVLTMAAHIAALNSETTDTGGRALKASASRTRAASPTMDVDGCRHVVRLDAERHAVKRDAPVHDCTARIAAELKRDMRRDHRPDWAREIAGRFPRTAQRWTHRAKVRRDRSRERTAKDRAKVRAAHGVPVVS